MGKFLNLFTLFLIPPLIAGCGQSLNNLPQKTFIPLPGLKISLQYVPGNRRTAEGTPAYTLPVSHPQSSSFWMSATEINVAIFCVFLRAHPELAPAYTHQVQTFRASQFRPKPGQARTPITRVSAEDAKKFCEWLSTHSGLPCRLPTPQEWQHMAGNGLNGAPYPWGWESPEVRAVWKTDGPKPSGHYPSSPPGFDDVIGNVYEWSEDPDTGRSYIHGGAWSDDREEALQIQNPFEQPPDFRSTDIGFRILVERQ